MNILELFFLLYIITIITSLILLCIDKTFPALVLVVFLLVITYVKDKYENNEINSIRVISNNNVSDRYLKLKSTIDNKDFSNVSKQYLLEKLNDIYRDKIITPEEEYEYNSLLNIIK